MSRYRKLIALLGACALALVPATAARADHHLTTEGNCHNTGTTDPDGNTWTKVDGVPSGVQTTYGLLFEGTQVGTVTTNSPEQRTHDRRLPARLRGLHHEALRQGRPR
jgi:hypothetical protein